LVRWHRRMIKSRRKSVGDRRHRRRIQTPNEIEGWLLTEPEDAGFDASRKLGAKGKPEDAMPVKAGGQTEGRSKKVDGRCKSAVGWKEKSETQVPMKSRRLGWKAEPEDASFDASRSSVQR